MSRKHMGSSIDDFLKEEGIFEEAQAQAIKEVVAWQLAEAMKKKKISKSLMAALLKASRTQGAGADMPFNVCGAVVSTPGRTQTPTNRESAPARLGRATSSALDWRILAF